MLGKHLVLSGIMLGASVSLILWFTYTDAKELVIYLLSSVVTLGLIAATIFLVQRGNKVDPD